MKKNNIFRVLLPVLGVTFALLLANVLFGVFAISGAVAAVGTAVIGDPVYAEDVQGAGDLNLDHVSRQVVKMRPAATPLDTIMRQVANKKVPAFKTSYYAVDSRPLNDTLSALDAGGNATEEITPTTISMWNEDDTVKFVGVEGSDGDDLVAFVTVKGTSTITIQPLNGTGSSASSGGTCPALAAGTVMVRMGPAKSEQDAQTEPYGLIPDDSYNYSQIFMAQTEEGTYQKAHAQEADWTFGDMEELNIYDMKAVMENSFLFGVKKYMNDAKASPKKRYWTGGITREITNALSYGTGGANRTVTEADFITWAKDIFADNSGSERRVLFMGDGLTAYISQIDTVSKQIQSNKTFTKWGLTFSEIETNFGTLLCKYHPGFTQNGWGDKGLVLDLNHIEKRVFKQMEIRELNLRESGQRNVTAHVLEEASCLIAKYPDTHAIISPAS